MAGEVLERVIADARTYTDISGSQGTNTYNVAGSRQVAFDSLGRLWCVFLQDDDGSGFMEVWLARRLKANDYALTQITDVAFDQSQPQIYIGDDDVIHIAWVGRGFGLLNPGTVHINYVRVTNLVVGTTELVLDDAADAYICSLTVTEDNRPFVAMCRKAPTLGLDVFERTGALAWAQRLTAIHTNVPESPSMLIDNADVLHILFADVTYAGGVATGDIVHKTFNTDTFAQITTVVVDAQGGRTMGNTTVTSIQCQMAVDAANDAHVVYLGIGPLGNSFAISYQRQVGGTFQGQQVLAGDLVGAGSPQGPQITVDSADNIYAFYHFRKPSSGAFSRMNSRKSIDNGVTFQAEQTVSTVQGYMSVMFQPHPTTTQFAEDEWMMVAESDIAAFGPGTTVEADFFNDWFFVLSAGTLSRFTADRVLGPGAGSIDPLFGSRYYQVSADGAAPINQFCSIGQQVTATPGEVWSFACRSVRINSITYAHQLIAEFRNSGGGIVGTFSTGDFFPGPGWDVTDRTLLNITAPADTASVRVIVQVRTTSSVSGGEAGFTGIRAVLGATMPAWPDFKANRLLSGSFQDFRVVGGVEGAFPPEPPPAPIIPAGGSFNRLLSGGAGGFLTYISPQGRLHPLHTPHEFGRWVVSFSGFGTPPIQYVTQRAPFQDGSTVRDFFLRPRVIQLLIRQGFVNRTAWWAGRATLLDDIRPNRQTSDALNEPGVLRLVETDGTIRDLHVFISEGPQFEPRVSNRWDEHAFQEVLRFIAHDPVAFDPAQVTATFALNLAAQLVFPITFPIQFGSGLVDDTININYLGTWLELPVITIVGPIQDFRIDNNGTGEKLEFNTAIGVGRTVTVDLRDGRKTVVDDLGNNLIGNLTDDSDLGTFHLAPDPEVTDGLNAIRVRGNNPTGATSISIAYFDRYFGF